MARIRRGSKSSLGDGRPNTNANTLSTNDRLLFDGCRAAASSSSEARSNHRVGGGGGGGGSPPPSPSPPGGGAPPPPGAGRPPGLEGEAAPTSAASARCISACRRSASVIQMAMLMSRSMRYKYRSPKPSWR